jgi:hypothetical protein
LKDARVTLLVKDRGQYGLFNGAPSSQLNPQMTDEGGRYAFIVPEGTYALRFDKDGYDSVETLGFRIGNENVITRSATMRLEAPTLEELVEIAQNTEASVADRAAAILEGLGKNAQNLTADAVDRLVEAAQNELVKEQVTNYVAPTATAAAIANAVTVASAIPYLNFVFSFLAHPLLLIARRKRKQWGVVYNSLTKLPVDLAIVRLIDTDTKRIVRSAVTDRDGRYFFIVDEGNYLVSVVKPGFSFPSVYSKDLKVDARYADVYHGESIEAKKDDSIAVNVPLDPPTEEKAPLRVMLEGVARRLQKSAGLLAILAMGIVTAFNQTPLMFGLLGANVLMYMFFHRLAIPRRPKNWGVVYDEHTERPLSSVVVRIFETKFNKLLETQVTDMRGRYAFLVGDNVYYVTYEKPGYQKQQHGPVDRVKIEEKNPRHVVADDVHLKQADDSEAGKTVSGKARDLSLVSPFSALHPGPTARPPLPIIMGRTACNEQGGCRLWVEKPLTDWILPENRMLGTAPAGFNHDGHKMAFHAIHDRRKQPFTVDPSVCDEQGGCPIWVEKLATAWRLPENDLLGTKPLLCTESERQSASASTPIAEDKSKNGSGLNRRLWELDAANKKTAKQRVTITNKPSSREVASKSQAGTEKAATQGVIGQSPLDVRSMHDDVESMKKRELWELSMINMAKESLMEDIASSKKPATEVKTDDQSNVADGLSCVDAPLIAAPEEDNRSDK